MTANEIVRIAGPCSLDALRGANRARREDEEIEDDFEDLMISDAARSLHPSAEDEDEDIEGAEAAQWAGTKFETKVQGNIKLVKGVPETTRDAQFFMPVMEACRSR